MRKRSFFVLFSSLSYKERKGLRQFLLSPYHNKREELVTFHDLLEEMVAINLIEEDETLVYKALFPKETYDDLKFRHTLSHYKKAIEQFLISEDWNEDAFDRTIRLAKIFRKKELNGLYEKQMRQSFKYLEQEPYRDLDHHYSKYRLYLEEYEYAHRTRRGGSMYLQEQTDALTIFYMSGILRQSCIIMSHQNLNAREYDQKLLDVVIAEVKSGSYLEEPAIAIYYYSLMALQDPTREGDFKMVCKIIDKSWEVFGAMEIRDIYILAINYCIRRLNKGDRDYIRIGFELYRSGLERKCLLDNKHISPFAYKNVLMLGMSLEEHQWVEYFLYEYKKYLAPEIRENTFNYNLAIYYFRKPDYDQAMELLQTVDFKDVLNNLDARRMLLRIYYEMGAYDALDSHLDSFRQYISRQKELGYHRGAYLNLIKYVKKTLSTNLRNKDKKESLKKEMLAVEAFAEKDWLLEQLQ